MKQNETTQPEPLNTRGVFSMCAHRILWESDTPIPEPGISEIDDIEQALVYQERSGKLDVTLPDGSTTPVSWRVLPEGSRDDGKPWQLLVIMSASHARKFKEKGLLPEEIYGSGVCYIREFKTGQEMDAFSEGMYTRDPYSIHAIYNLPEYLLSLWLTMPENYHRQIVMLDEQERKAYANDPLPQELLTQFWNLVPLETQCKVLNLPKLCKLENFTKDDLQYKVKNEIAPELANANIARLVLRTEDDAEIKESLDSLRKIIEDNLIGFQY